MTSTIPPIPAQPLPVRPLPVQFPPVQPLLRSGQSKTVSALDALGYPTMATTHHGEVKQRADAPTASFETVDADTATRTVAPGTGQLVEPAANADDDLSSAVTQVRAVLRQPGTSPEPSAARMTPGYPGPAGYQAGIRPGVQSGQSVHQAPGYQAGVSYSSVVPNPCYQAIPQFGGVPGIAGQQFGGVPPNVGPQFGNVPYYPGDPRFNGPQQFGGPQFGGVPIAPGYPSAAPYPSASVYPGHYPSAQGLSSGAWATQAPSDLIGARCGQLAADEAVWGSASVLAFLLLGGLSLGAALLFGPSAPTAYVVLAVVLTVLQFVVPVALSWFFHAYWPSRHGGQTVAMKWLRLRVVAFDGTQPSLGALSVRWLLLLVDRFCFIGLFVASNSLLGQRLGDKAANTVVVRVR